MGSTPLWTFAPAGQTSYVYPSSGLKPPFEVIVELDDVFTGTPKLPIVQGAFTVQAGGGDLPYQVVAGANAGVWCFDPTKRTVRSDFDELLAALEAAGLKPGRLQLIRGYLAQALPQTFPETLYIRHGWDPARRCVDLAPGMRVRVDFQAHQAVDPASDPLNGFVGAGVAHVEVAQLATPQGGVATVFDPFLSSLQGFSVPAGQGGAGGAVDLQGAGFQLSYWRALYPQSYPSSDGTGFAGVQENVVLMGAPTWADLQSATQTYLSQATVQPPAVGSFFRGRAAVVPEVPVYIQGQRCHVALGTTVRGLLCGLGPVPWLAGGTVQFPTQGYSRLWTPLGGTSAKWSPATYADVDFLHTYECYGENLDSFDLPVLGGDALSLTVPVANG